MNNPVLFNITFKIDTALSKQWLTKMQHDYLPQCTDGNIIIESQINKVMLEGEDDGETFAVHFIYASQNLFKDQKLPTMKRFLDLLDKDFRGQYVYFPTVMQILFRETYK